MRTRHWAKILGRHHSEHSRMLPKAISLVQSRWKDRTWRLVALHHPRQMHGTPLTPGMMYRHLNYPALHLGMLVYGYGFIFFSSNCLMVQESRGCT